MPDKPSPDLDQLLKYQQKRDFTQTTEPSGGRAPEDGDLAFVVQQHAATRLHWDFRLEVDGVLVSWAIPKGPSLNPKDKRVAAHVEDHPYDYGSFEGVIPKGNYGAGQVIVWDNGTYTPDEKGEYSWGDKAEGSRRIREDMARGKISFTLRGKKLKGSWTLVQIKGDPKNWLLIKHRDEFASTRDVLAEDRSVLSGLTLQDLKEGRMPKMAESGGPPHPLATAAPFPDPRTLRPMSATPVERPFARDGWIFEPKLDGVRVLAFVQDNAVELRSRRGNIITAQYPEIVRALVQQGVSQAVFDGEIVAVGENGAPSFQALQGRINLSRPAEVAAAAAEIPAYLYLFDVLYIDGWDVHGCPLVERKTLLRRNIATSDHLKLVEHEQDGMMLFEAARNVGFEGVVAKRAQSVYEAGVRSRSWLKIKAVNEQEFVIGGFTEGEGSRSKTFGGILVGYWEDRDKRRLRFAGSVGSGFTDRMLDLTYRLLKGLQTEESPFADPPTVIGGRWAGGKAAKCYWVKPELVAQVKYLQWTDDGHLRAPVFIGLRDDVDPDLVRREVSLASVIDVVQDEPALELTDLERISSSVVDQLDAISKADFTLDVGGVPIRLTNLDKEFWPATSNHPARTKRDLIRYYARIAPTLLPHLRDRPLTLTRYPNGIHGKSFYQKHWGSPFPTEFRVERVQVYSSHNDANGEYILVNNIQTLIWLGQLADLELHASMARVNPEPDAGDLPTVFSGDEATLEASVLNYPDYMVFDLDPYIYAGTEAKGEEPAFNRRGYEKTREVAFRLKEILEQLRLSSFAKTTGKTGLHIYVPVLRQYTYDEIRAASGTVGQFMVEQYPDDVTMEWQTQKRTGKVFFDHGQNTRGKTLAAQYSVRPSAGANVSAPVSWSELASVAPPEFDMDSVPSRVSRTGDLWAGILDAKQDLRALIGAEV